MGVRDVGVVSRAEGVEEAERQEADETVTDAPRSSVKDRAERRRREMRAGVAMTIVGGVMWGLNGTLSKVLMDDYAVEPLWLACVRELTACWLFLAVAWARDSRRVRACLADRHAVRGLVSVGICSILLSQVAYLEAIDWTNSATATVLQSLSVAIVMAYVCLVDRRRPRRRELAGVVLALAGTYLVATGGNPAALSLPPEGLAWGLCCAVAATILAIQPVGLIGRWGNFTVNGFAFLVSGIVLLATTQPWAHMPVLDARGWALIAFSVVLGTFGAYGLYLQGVRRVGSVRGSMLATSEPLTAMLTSVVLTGVAFTPADLAGFAMIIAMVFLTA